MDLTLKISLYYDIILRTLNDSNCTLTNVSTN